MILTITSCPSIVESCPPRTEQPSSIPSFHSPEVALYESPSKLAAEEDLGEEQQHWAWRSPPRSYRPCWNDSDLGGDVSSQALNVIPVANSFPSSPVRKCSARDDCCPERRETKKNDSKFAHNVKASHADVKGTSVVRSQAAPSGTGARKRKAGSRADAKARQAGRKIVEKMSKKDPARPRYPCSSYMLFYMARREEYLKTRPGISTVELGKVLGEAWRALSGDERMQYTVSARRDRERYGEELCAIGRRNTTSDRKTSRAEASRRGSQTCRRRRAKREQTGP